MAVKGWEYCWLSMLRPLRLYSLLVRLSFGDLISDERNVTNFGR